jgi:hypothetical protein
VETTKDLSINLILEKGFGFEKKRRARKSTDYTDYTD